MADAHQRHVIQEIIAIGRARRMPRKAILAALVTGSVETRFRNLKRGDKDSLGWRQERAMYYKNPRDLRASINRFYDEWEADANPRSSIGEQAQAVQQSAYPGRYQTRLPIARRLLSRHGGAPGGSLAGGSLTGVTGRAPRVKAGKIDYGGALVDTLLSNRGRPGSLMRAIELAESDPQYRTPPQIVPGKTRKYKVPAAGPGDIGRTVKGKGGGKIHEVFYDPLGEYFDSGKVVKGAIGGHGSHVHVAASPRLVIRLGKLAQKRGLTVRENPAFDPVDPVHTKGSFHYKRRAIDVSGDSAKLRQFARDVMRMAR